MANLCYAQRCSWRAAPWPQSSKPHGSCSSSRCKSAAGAAALRPVAPTRAPHSWPARGGNSRLTRFDLSGRDLRSVQIPASPGKLIHLEYLQLRDANLGGTLPAALRTLTALKHLDVSENALTGTLPAALSALTALTRKAGAALLRWAVARSIAPLGVAAALTLRAAAEPTAPRRC